MGTRTRASTNVPALLSRVFSPSPLAPPTPKQADRRRGPQGQYLFSHQELISEHFGEDGSSYETEIQGLEDLRQVGGLLPLLLLQRQKRNTEGWIPT